MARRSLLLRQADRLSGCQADRPLDNERRVRERSKASGRGDAPKKDPRAGRVFGSTPSRPRFDPVSTPFRPHFDPILTLLRTSLPSNVSTCPPPTTQPGRGWSARNHVSAANVSQSQSTPEKLCLVDGGVDETKFVQKQVPESGHNPQRVFTSLRQARLSGGPL